MKLFLAGVLLLAPGAWCQNRFEKFDRDLKQAADELRISDLRASVVESGHVVWRHGAAKTEHAGLAWSTQELFGERILWSYEPALLVVKIPGRKLALTISANSKSLTEAPRLEDGNLARSTIALAFVRDIAGLGNSERDELIDGALTALYRGER